MSLSTKKSVSIGRRKVNPLHKLSTVKEDANEAKLEEETVQEKSFFETLSNELQSNKPYISINAAQKEAMYKNNDSIETCNIGVSGKI